MAERGNGQPDLNKGKPVETDAAPGLDEQRLLNTFFELVRIASPSHYEADVAAYCQAVLLDAGWQVTIDDSAAVTGSDTGNLTATLAGSAATRGAAAATGGVAAAATATSPTAADHLFFSAHLDTVEPASGIVPVLSDGVIRSAGATILGGDDKAGVAALLEMARVLGERARRPPPQALQRPLP
ncbi:MAG: M28 family peptidase, partial [Coriobacteriales bacterium]|nr:M28 family peptidase [Coriobacteriales bacterium]